MPGAPSPTRCPGQLSQLFPLCLRTWNIHTHSPERSPNYSQTMEYSKITKRTLQDQSSCFVQVPILSLPTPPSVQIKVAGQMRLLLGTIEAGDNGIHLHLMGTQEEEGPSTLM